MAIEPRRYQHVAVRSMLETCPLCASRSIVYLAKSYMVRVIPVKRVTDAMPQKILTSRRISYVVQRGSQA
jgi:hypothetical protein